MQLTYEPAFDPLHSIFRALRLREALGASFRLPRDLFRILDFYLLYPTGLRHMPLRSIHLKLKRLAASTKRAEPYGPRPGDPILFERMRPFQDAAVETLALQGFLSTDALGKGWVENAGKPIPAILAGRVETANSSEGNLLSALRAIAQYPLEGPNGLKDRSGLLEHRYDAV